MAEDRDPTYPGGSAYAFGVQELVGVAGDAVRAFVLLLETIGGQIEYPFHKLSDPASLNDRFIYVEYDGNDMVRYTVKHHGIITGELVSPTVVETNDTE